MFDELVDEDTRADLIDGVMVVHSPASPTHDKVSGLLRSLMGFYADVRDAGQVFGPDSLVRLGEGRRVGPDVFFVRSAKVPRPLPATQFDLVPDLVVEILSPSNRGEDLGRKREAYRDAGVTEIWLIDPERRTVTVDRRKRRGYEESAHKTGKVESSALPGFWVRTSWLWADPPPNKMTCLRQILREREA
jgi:Uma2 family endonuclease